MAQTNPCHIKVCHIVRGPRPEDLAVLEGHGTGGMGALPPLPLTHSGPSLLVDDPRDEHIGLSALPPGPVWS